MGGSPRTFELLVPDGLSAPALLWGGRSDPLVVLCVLYLASVTGRLSGLLAEGAVGRGALGSLRPAALSGLVFFTLLASWP